MYKVSNIFFFYFLFFFSQLEKRLEMGCKTCGLNTITAWDTQSFSECLVFAVCPQPALSERMKIEIILRLHFIVSLHGTSVPLAAGVQL